MQKSRGIETVRITVEIDKKLKEKIDNFHDEYGQSQTYIIEDSLRKYFKNKS